MHALRRFFLGHRRYAAIVIALALAVKVLVPAGFMPSVAGGRIAVTLCPGAEPAMAAMGGMKHGSETGDRHEGTREAPCVFAGLSAPSLAAADPLLLAAAIVFVMASGFRIAVRPGVTEPPHLRPPSRGPPALA